MKNLYKQKTDYGLKKVKMSETLIANMILPNSRRRIESCTIIKVLERVTRLALRNPFSIMHESWEENQASNYFWQET